MTGVKTSSFGLRISNITLQRPVANTTGRGTVVEPDRDLNRSFMSHQRGTQGRYQHPKYVGTTFPESDTSIFGGEKW